jgi:hypothetical protein
VINLLKPKVAQNVAISLSYFILPKNHNDHPKVAHGTKLPNLITLLATLTIPAFGTLGNVTET